jgi:hypothetical protein
MARPRNRPASEASSEGSTTNGFTCPECGRTFARAAALGAHRSRVHGVPGQRAGKPPAKRVSTNGTRRGQASTVVSRARSGTRTRVATAATATAVDRDRLLQTLFPNGVPPREDVIRRVSSWLDEAERLTKLAK